MSSHDPSFTPPITTNNNPSFSSLSPTSTTILTKIRHRLKPSTIISSTRRSFCQVIPLASNHRSSLLKAILSHNWSRVSTLCSTKPHEAQIWSTIPNFHHSRSGGQSTCLPLHAACSLPPPDGPPLDVLLGLIVAYPPAAMARESGYGRLPLHVACYSNVGTESVRALCLLCPCSAFETDDLGRVPLHYLVMGGGGGGSDDGLSADVGGLGGTRCNKGSPRHNNKDDHSTTTITTINNTTNNSTLDSVTELLLASTEVTGSTGLLESGFTRDYRGWTPLHVACRARASVDIIRLLVRVFPDSIRQRTNAGSKPMNLARDSWMRSKEKEKEERNDDLFRIVEGVLMGREEKMDVDEEGREVEDYVMEEGEVLLKRTDPDASRRILDTVQALIQTSSFVAASSSPTSSKKSNRRGRVRGRPILAGQIHDGVDSVADLDNVERRIKSRPATTSLLSKGGMVGSSTAPSFMGRRSGMDTGVGVGVGVGTDGDDTRSIHLSSDNQGKVTSFDGNADENGDTSTTSSSKEKRVGRRPSTTTSLSFMGTYGRKNVATRQSDTFKPRSVGYFDGTGTDNGDGGDIGVGGIYCGGGEETRSTNVGEEDEDLGMTACGCGSGGGGIKIVEWGDDDGGSWLV